MEAEQPSILNISASIGFNNYTKDSLCIHPSDLHLIWAQGSVLVIKSIGQERNSYLKGHEGKICAITCSKNGMLLASGEERGSGCLAGMIVWDFLTSEMMFRVRYHKEAIRAMSFSSDSNFLVSLGGLADNNQLVCWNMIEGRSECVMVATNQTNQECTDVKFYNNDPRKFVTCHNNAIKFWQFDNVTHKMSFFDCQLGMNKRMFNCISIDAQDQFLYCGSRLGDIIEISLRDGGYRRTGPVKKIFQGGIVCLNSSFDSLIFGCLNGYMARIEKKNFQFIEEFNLEQGAIISIASSSEKIWALTQNGTLHNVDGNKSLKTQSKFLSVMMGKVGKIVFPTGFSEVFACMSYDEIRIFNVADQRELLRIQLAEKETQRAMCNCVEFTSDGKSLITGWTDGKVRAFTPQSGKLLYVIQEAHQVQKPSGTPIRQVTSDSALVPKGVTCLNSSIDAQGMLTGGYDGEVRLWQIGKQTQKLNQSQRMHKAPVTGIKYMQQDSKAGSCSIDGQIILWDLQVAKNQKPLIQIAVLNTPIPKSIEGQCGVCSLQYNPITNNLLALGLDKRVTFWSQNERKLVKQLQAGYEVDVNAFAISADGQLIVVGDEIGEMKLFTYNDCRLIHLERVHCSAISAVCVSPDNTLILTADEYGQIFFWRI